MRILVMGGSFFIGYHLVQELLRHDHEVTVCNIDSRSYPARVTELYCDRKDHEALRTALAGLEFDAVVDNTAFDRDDLEPMIEIFSQRTAQYVFTSSSTTYARSAIQPLCEDFPLESDDARNVAGSYGAGKARCEAMLREAHQSRGFPVTIVRPTHCLGPDNYNLGWEPSFFARLEQGRPILVPGDGMPLVPFVHVDDLAKGFATLLGDERAIGEAFNVVGSEVVTLDGIIRLMAEAVGVEPEIVHFAAERVAEIPDFRFPYFEYHWGHLVPSNWKMREYFGWRPQHDFASGLRDAYAWYQREGRALLEKRADHDFSAEETFLRALRR